MVIGGDIREQGVPLHRIRDNIRQLRRLGPVYAVYGNHDYDESIRPVDELLRQEQAVPLINESVVLNKGSDQLVLCGVDDPITGREVLQGAFSFLNSHDKTSHDSPFTILVSHDPNLIDWLDGLPVDLMLSGHTHGGKSPFLLLDRCQGHQLSTSIAGAGSRQRTATQTPAPGFLSAAALALPGYRCGCWRPRRPICLFCGTGGYNDCCRINKSVAWASRFESSESSASAVQGTSCMRILAPGWSWLITFRMTAAGLFRALSAQSSEPLDHVMYNRAWFFCNAPDLFIA